MDWEHVPFNVFVKNMGQLVIMKRKMDSSLFALSYNLSKSNFFF